MLVSIKSRDRVKVVEILEPWRSYNPDLIWPAKGSEYVCDIAPHIELWQHTKDRSIITLNHNLYHKYMRMEIPYSFYLNIEEIYDICKNIEGFKA